MVGSPLLDSTVTVYVVCCDYNREYKENTQFAILRKLRGVLLVLKACRPFIAGGLSRVPRKFPRGLAWSRALHCTLQAGLKWVGLGGSTGEKQLHKVGRVVAPGG